MRFCSALEPYDELVLMNLGQFDRKTLKSIENELAVEHKDDTSSAARTGTSSKTAQVAYRPPPEAAAAVRTSKGRGGG